MKLISRSAHHGPRMAPTQVFHLLDNQLLVLLRPWGSSDYNQKFLDEIAHYLSSTQADLEVTTPFDYQENLSALANRTRVALLLAHDLFYKHENKSEYSVGFEAMVLFTQRNELAWSTVGRFALDKVTGGPDAAGAPGAVNHLLQSGSDLDHEILLPAQLIGLEREIDIVSGSLVFDERTRLVVSSVFGCELQIRPEESSEALVDAAGGGAYWFAVVSRG